MAFIRTHLPVESFPRLLDVACGIGRHAHPLARTGYDVLGTDISPEAVSLARESAPDRARFIEHDMRDLDSLRSDFDGALCLWQSFGAFDTDVNDRVLGAMSRRLRRGGRLLLDTYNRETLASLASESHEQRSIRVDVRRQLVGNRFRVSLRYEGREETDDFDWEVFTPDEIVARAAGAGLRPLIRCAWFDPEIQPGPEHVRMQLLFERE